MKNQECFPLDRTKFAQLDTRWAIVQALRDREEINPATSWVIEIIRTELIPTERKPYSSRVRNPFLPVERHFQPEIVRQVCQQLFDRSSVEAAEQLLREGFLSQAVVDSFLRKPLWTYWQAVQQQMESYKRSGDVRAVRALEWELRTLDDRVRAVVNRDWSIQEYEAGHCVGSAIGGLLDFYYGVNPELERRLFVLVAQVGAAEFDVLLDLPVPEHWEDNGWIWVEKNAPPGELPDAFVWGHVLYLGDMKVPRQCGNQYIGSRGEDLTLHVFL